MHIVPQRARERILDIASIQFPDGSTYHQYQPLTKRGNNDIGGGFNDDPLWLVGAVCAYVKETERLLHSGPPHPLRQCSWLQRPPLMEHIRRSIRFTRTHWDPTACPHRPGGLERLPESELLLHGTRRELPDQRSQRRPRGGIRIHCGNVREIRRRVRRPLRPAGPGR